MMNTFLKMIKKMPKILKFQIKAVDPKHLSINTVFLSHVSFDMLDTPKIIFAFSIIIRSI